MVTEKNYYILIPYSQAAQTWVSQAYNANEIENIGNNKVVLPIFHPANPFELCYQIELKETLVNDAMQELISLNSEIYDSADAYLQAYPPDDSDLSI